MRNRKSNRIAKAVIALTVVAASLFTLTGAVENAVTGNPKIFPVMLSMLKGVGNISAELGLSVKPLVSKEKPTESKD
ncbi:MAG: hypothetical protein IKT78_04430, partial [Ruminiclostridium sp.]|nr:hypothetical protein [Ruminiclostridium sp.]